MGCTNTAHSSARRTRRHEPVVNQSSRPGHEYHQVPLTSWWTTWKLQKRDRDKYRWCVSERECLIENRKCLGNTVLSTESSQRDTDKLYHGTHVLPDHDIGCHPGLASVPPGSIQIRKVPFPGFLYSERGEPRARTTRKETYRCCRCWRRVSWSISSFFVSSHVLLCATGLSLTPSGRCNNGRGASTSEPFL